MTRVNAVMHFAAHSQVGESVQNPRIYFQNNAEAGLALLNAALDAGVRSLFFPRLAQCTECPEDAHHRRYAAAARESYGTSKLFFENALEAYDRAYGMRYMSLRYFNAAGADESGEIGELHDPETHLIPAALKAITGERGELELFGADYPTPDGTCVRDYIHVNDLADAHVLALKHIEAGNSSAALNLGTGLGCSVKEVIAMIEEVTGSKVPRRMGPRRPGDPPALVADPSHAQAVLQWKAKRALREIVQTAGRGSRAAARRRARHSPSRLRGWRAKPLQFTL